MAEGWRLTGDSGAMDPALVALLSSASDLLSTSLAPEDAVRSLARLVVPTLADWSIVTLVDADGHPRDVDSWHWDPAKRARTARFAEHRLSDRTEASGLLASVGSGEPLVLSSGALAFVQQATPSPVAREALEGLELESIAFVPMLIAGRLAGVITLARGPGRAPMSDEEFAASVDLSRRASITLSNARSFEREQTMSDQLQLSMLTEPVPAEGLEVVVRYQPAAQAVQVGGDWYDAFVQDAGSTVLVVGDVVGHDTAAAAIMGQLRSILRGIAVTNTPGPARLLADVDHAIDSLRLGTSATAAVVTIEAPVRRGPDGPPEARMRCSNAGHPPPILIHADGTTVLAEHDVLLGIVPEQERHEQDLTLACGATLLMYTDGLIERRGEDFDTGLERLKSLLVELHELPLPSLVDQVIKRIVPDRHHDDVAVLAVRLRETTRSWLA